MARNTRNGNKMKQFNGWSQPFGPYNHHNSDLPNHLILYTSHNQPGITRKITSTVNGEVLRYVLQIRDAQQHRDEFLN